MHGMFRANGGCGYLKKPDFLMEKGANNEVFDPKIKLAVTKTLKVSVFVKLENEFHSSDNLFSNSFYRVTGESILGRWMAP